MSEEQRSGSWRWSHIKAARIAPAPAVHRSLWRERCQSHCGRSVLQRYFFGRTSHQSTSWPSARGPSPVRLQKKPVTSTTGNLASANLAMNADVPTNVCTARIRVRLAGAILIWIESGTSGDVGSPAAYPATVISDRPRAGLLVPIGPRIAAHAAVWRGFDYRCVVPFRP